MEGAEETSAELVAEQMLAQAQMLTRAEERDVTPEALAVIDIDPEALQPGVNYKIDPERQVPVRVED